MAPLCHVSYVLFEHPSLICLSVGYLIAPPPSPTSPSPTQAPLVTPMLPMAGLVMHRHVLIALFRFHLPTLADTILRFSHCISTYSNGALNPPRIVASATHSRGHVSVTGVGIEPSSPLSQHRPLSTVYVERQERQITEHVRRPRTYQQLAAQQHQQPNHFHQHYCECCCDFHPVRSHSAAVMALFVFVIVQLHSP